MGVKPASKAMLNLIPTSIGNTLFPHNIGSIPHHASPRYAPGGSTRTVMMSAPLYCWCRTDDAYALSS